MTNNSPGNAKKLCFLAVYVSFILALSIITNGCADDPSSLGLKFIPPGDTTGIKIFDSRIDTMPITFTSIRKYINTNTSGNLIVGQNNNNYSSKGLIKFTQLDNNHDSATVNSATLTLTYRNYYFPVSTADSLAQVSFDVYTVNQNMDYSTFTVDSIQTSTFGTTSQGNYTGIPTADTQEVTISLNPSMVKDWLEYAANNSYPVVNNGMVLSPNPSSAVLKAFYSSIPGNGNVRPALTIISTKNGVTDTMITREGLTFSLVTGTPASFSEVFPVQSGIMYIENLKFNLSHIPSTATINDAQIFLSLDSINSKFTSQTVKRIAASYGSDTAGNSEQPISYFYGDPLASGSNVYSIRIINPFQRWLQGQTNNGLQLTSFNQNVDLDLFYFYNLTTADVNRRPYVIIKYTPRVTP